MSLTAIQQVCTLAQAKKLQELGVKRKSLFGYIEIPDNGCPIKMFWHDGKYALIDADTIMFLGNGIRAWYAYNVAELGDILPHMITENGKSYPEYDFCCGRFCSDDPDEPTATRFWSCSYQHDNMCLALFEPENTEAECRTTMLIHLLDHGYITVATINGELHLVSAEMTEGELLKKVIDLSKHHNIHVSVLLTTIDSDSWEYSYEIRHLTAEEENKKRPSFKTIESILFGSATYTGAWGTYMEAMQKGIEEAEKLLKTKLK